MIQRKPNQYQTASSSYPTQDELDDSLADSLARNIGYNENTGHYTIHRKIQYQQFTVHNVGNIDLIKMTDKTTIVLVVL